MNTTDNGRTSPGTNDESSPSRRDYALTLVSLVIAVVFGSGLMGYLDGLIIPVIENSTFNWALFLAIWCLQPVVILWACFRLIARLSRRWQRLSPVERLGRLAVIVFLFASIIAGSVTRNAMFRYGFRTAMRYRADIGAIREWVETIKVLPDESIVVFIWPQCIQKFRPREIRVTGVDDGNEADISWRWGSESSGCGLVVGPETMVTPESSDSVYVLPVGQGSYVWQSRN